MTWQTEYPPVATVNVASFRTLATWDENLPAPQTDVEITVRRRIKRRMAELAPAELRREDPALGAQYDEVMRRFRHIFSKLGG